MFITNIINYFFFFDKAGCTRCFFSKTHQSSLTLKGGSTSHLGLLPSGKKRKPLLLVALNRYAIRLADHQRFFRKPTSPPLSLREGPPLSPSPFPLRVQGMYQPPYSVLKLLRYMVGGPSEVYASFLCGMEDCRDKTC